MTEQELIAMNEIDKDALMQQWLKDQLNVDESHFCNEGGKA